MNPERPDYRGPLNNNNNVNNNERPLSIVGPLNNNVVVSMLASRIKSNGFDSRSMGKKEWPILGHLYRFINHFHHLHTSPELMYA